MKRFLVFVLLVLVVFLSGCESISNRLQFSVSCDDGLLYICTSIVLTPVEETKVIGALKETPAGYGGSAVIDVDPHQLWNVQTVDDLVRIIKSSKGVN